MLAVGILAVTTKLAVTLPEANVPKESCVAVIIEVPIPTTVTVVPLIVATELLLLVYENDPPLFDVGAVN